MSSNTHASMVPTTIIQPTMVKGVNDLIVSVPIKPFGDDMSVVFKALSVEKCLPLSRINSSRITFLYLVDIGLVIRMNKHYIHARSLQEPEFFFCVCVDDTAQYPTILESKLQ